MTGPDTNSFDGKILSISEIEMTWEWNVPTDPHAFAQLVATCGSRIDKIITFQLAKERPEISRSRVQSLFEQGLIFCNGVIAPHANGTVQAGQRWTVHFPKPSVFNLQPVDRPLPILFEDEHLAVINKPAGLVTHPAPTVKEATLVEVLMARLGSLSQVGGVERPGIVHRLDQWTSGVMVVSKTDQAHQLLQKQFAEHTIERRYLALTYGRLAQPKITLKSLIGRHPVDRNRMSTEVTSGRDAITHFTEKEVFFAGGKNQDEGAAFFGKSLAGGSHESMAQLPVASLIEAQLETGRTHQVRVHLAKLGTSVIGDKLYGVPTERSEKWRRLSAEVRNAIGELSGQLLQAYVLGFTHPITGAGLRFEIELEPRMQNLVDLLKAGR